MGSSTVYFVFQVQYQVLCFPRIWVMDVLMWQPTELLPPAEPDEWMYEVQNLESEKSDSLPPRILLDIFIRAKEGFGGVKQEIMNTKSQYASLLTPQDIACLNHLEATLDSPRKTSRCDALSSPKKQRACAIVYP